MCYAWIEPVKSLLCLWRILHGRKKNNRTLKFVRQLHHGWMSKVIIVTLSSDEQRSSWRFHLFTPSFDRSNMRPTKTTHQSLLSPHLFEQQDIHVYSGANHRSVLLAACAYVFVRLSTLRPSLKLELISNAGKVWILHLQLWHWSSETIEPRLVFQVILRLPTWTSSTTREGQHSFHLRSMDK